MLQVSQPHGFLSAWDVKGVAADVIRELSLPGIEGSLLDPGDIWPVAILASVNQTSVREVCAENSEALCDDTVFDWLHTLDRGWLEFAANLLFMQLAIIILDRSRSRIASIDFVDNPYHGTYNDEEGERCRMSPKDGTTTCHRYCTAYLVANGNPVTLAMTYVRSDAKEADAPPRRRSRSRRRRARGCSLHGAGGEAVRSPVRVPLRGRVFRACSECNPTVIRPHPRPQHLTRRVSRRILGGRGEAYYAVFQPEHAVSQSSMSAARPTSTNSLTCFESYVSDRGEKSWLPIPPRWPPRLRVRTVGRNARPRRQARSSNSSVGTARRDTEHARRRH